MEPPDHPGEHGGDQSPPTLAEVAEWASESGVLDPTRLRWIGAHPDTPGLLVGLEAVDAHFADYVDFSRPPDPNRPTPPEVEARLLARIDQLVAERRAQN